MTTPEPTGIDLARVALKAARDSARKNGAPNSARKTKTRPTWRRGSEREPLSLSATISGLITEHAWEEPARVGNVDDWWPAIAGADLAEHVKAVKFLADTGQLEVRADSPAYATQIRLLAPALLARIRNELGTDAVKTIKNVAQGGIRSQPVAGPREASAQPQGNQPAPPPVKTRQMASAGYHKALAAHLHSRRATAKEAADA